MLIRFARAPDGALTPDLGEKLPGRGAWVLADRDALQRAVTKGLFNRAFKAETKAPDDLADQIEAGLERRASDALGLARRQGAAVAGFDQVKAALDKGEAGVLIAAFDAADDGREKLARRAGKTPVFRGLSSAALSAALGKDGVKHAAIVKGAAATRFLKEAQRLSGFRPGALDRDDEKNESRTISDRPHDHK